MVRRGKKGTTHLLQIQHYLQTGNYLSSVKSSEKNGIRKSAKKFIIESDQMFYVGLNKQEKRLVLTSDEEKKSVFQEAHISLMSQSHNGRHKTLCQLNEKYYWTSMVEDVVEMISKCKTCETTKLNQSSQQCIRVTEPWQVVSIDILGQFSVTDEGYVFATTFIDMLTKYTYTAPMRDLTVQDVSDALLSVIYIQGLPEKFIFNQSPEFVYKVNQLLDKECGVENLVVPVSKAQIDRPVETIIKRQILELCFSSAESWSSSIPKKVFEINTSSEINNGRSAFKRMYQRNVRTINKQENKQNPDSLNMHPEVVKFNAMSTNSQEISGSLSDNYCTEAIPDSPMYSKEENELIYPTEDGEGQVVLVANGLEDNVSNSPGSLKQSMVIVQKPT